MHRHLRSSKVQILRREALAGGGRDIVGRRSFNSELAAYRLRGVGEKRKREDESVACGICLEQKTNLVTTPCEHRFCRVCLQTWFDTSCCSCPLCRNELWSPKALGEAAKKGYTAFLKVMLARGANPNARLGDDEETACHIAAQYGHVHVLEFLLARGADPNTKRRSDGATPCFTAAQNGHAGVVRLLLAHGSNCNNARTDGMTPVHIAMEGGHSKVVAILKQEERNRKRKRYFENKGIVPASARVWSQRRRTGNVSDSDSDSDSDVDDFANAIVAAMMQEREISDSDSDSDSDVDDFANAIAAARTQDSNIDSDQT